MLTTQSAMPDAVLQPFVHCYVQRVSKAGEVIEPVFPRTATMLIFQFATVYEVKEYETEQRRRSWAATVVGPIAARRTRSPLSISVSAKRRASPIACNCWTNSSSIGCGKPVRSIRPLAPCTGWPQADAT